MPDTIEDRAVIIRMRRRAPGESVAPYRQRRDRPALRNLAQQLTEWLHGDLAALEAAVPDMPVEDRAADTWEPLVTIADHAAGHWPHTARTALLALTADADEPDQGALKPRLLADCRTIFSDQPALPTSYLLDRLNADPEAPWADYGHGGLGAAKLGRLLREYDIRSGNIRFPDGTQAKGYRRIDFVDAWTRYCPPTEGNAYQPSQPSQPSTQRDAIPLWDGPSRTSQPTRTNLTSNATPGTAGTATPGGDL